MRAVLLIGLCFSFGFGTAQTVILPSWVVDSLIYESKLSRQCSNVVTAQQAEIQALGVELVHTNTALRLSESKSSTLSKLLENQKESQNILTKQFSLNISKEKRKTKRWRRVSILEGLGIIGLILLL